MASIWATNRRKVTVKIREKKNLDFSQYPVNPFLFIESPLKKKQESAIGGLIRFFAEFRKNPNLPK